MATKKQHTFAPKKSDKKKNEAASSKENSAKSKQTIKKKMIKAIFFFMLNEIYPVHVFVSLFDSLMISKQIIAAIIIKPPPTCTASTLSLFNTVLINHPKPSEAIISGSTIKKLKIPI